MGAQSRAFSQAVARFTDRSAGLVAFEVMQELISATPKDTSYTASKWRAQFGSSTLPTESPLSRAERAARVKGEAGRQRALMVGLLKYDGAFGDIHIINATAQIERLNAGSSTQAGPHFIEAAIARGIRNAGGL